MKIASVLSPTIFIMPSYKAAKIVIAIAKYIMGLLRDERVAGIIKK
ncbi:MAG: hypothetical protein ACIPMY_05145 [Rickettsia endosymbiont of Pentastiridius leporinus]